MMWNFLNGDEVKNNNFCDICYIMCVVIFYIILGVYCFLWGLLVYFI